MSLRFARRVLPAVPLAGLLLLVGCNDPVGGLTGSRDLPTLDRLALAYEDLASKRFQVLADFEIPEQGSLFRLDPPGGAGAVAMSTARARSETGAGALRVSLSSPRQRLVAADTDGARWALHRDWSPHHLLLLSVFSPRKLGGFSVSAHSAGVPVGYTWSRLALNEGWNLLRLDLGDAAEVIDLSDVREVRFWCDPLDSPVELYLDDIVLADNARDLLASRDAEPGELYVRVEGRRLVVGAAQRFELVFSRGQLRQWYDLGQDPGRTQGLAGPGLLGPIPVVMSSTGGNVTLDDRGQWSGLGAAAEVRQHLVEANSVYVLIQGECRFGLPNAPFNEGSPAHRWIYSVYRDGRIYVECSGTGWSGDFKPGGIGFALCCEGSLGFESPVIEAGSESTGDGPLALFSRPERGRADLLVVPSGRLKGRALQGGPDTRQCVLWPMSLQTETFAFAAMLRVWPPDIDGPQQAAPFALDYHRPLPVAIDAGRLVTTDPGDWNNDGFSEARGYYVLQLDGNVAKARIDGRQHLRFAPVFKLVGVLDRDVWVYVNGRLIRNLQRDRDGNVVFQLPGVIDQETLLEITSRSRQAESRPS